MPPRSISDEFNDSYAEQGLQPATGPRGVIKYPQVEYGSPTNTLQKTGTGLRASGTALKVTGQGAQIGGRGLQRGGAALARGGAALSATGLGSIVGVPLMAIGGATTAAGTGINAAGKISERTGAASNQAGRTMRKTGKSRAAVLGTNPLKSARAVKGRIKVTRITVTIFSLGLPVWFSFQLPIALINAIAFGSTATALELLPAFLVEWTVGGIFQMTQFVVFAIGLATLLTMSFMYIFSGISCLFGEGAAAKVSTFIFALFGYFMPFLNIFPWFALWALAVWRYPK
jgi:hypothetical protein